MNQTIPVFGIGTGGSLSSMHLVLSFFVGVTLAVPSRSSVDSHHYVVHETRPAEPIHWANTGRLDSNQMLPMNFGLTQQNLHKVEEMLTSVSHPESPTYAQHFGPVEVIDTFAPSKETICAVINWIINSGFSRDRLHLSRNKGWIHVNAFAFEVENLLRTEYHVYTHPSGDKQIGGRCSYCPNYLIIVSRMPQLFSAKSSPAAHRYRQTYCILQLLTICQRCTKARCKRRLRQKYRSYAVEQFCRFLG